jgi:hypothetical protein
LKYFLSSQIGMVSSCQIGEWNVSCQGLRHRTLARTLAPVLGPVKLDLGRVKCAL